MITEFIQIERIFDELSSVPGTAADVYMIGGGALMYTKSKDITKDIDIVVNTKQEFDGLSRSLMTIGFKPMIPDNNAYSRLAVSQIFVRDVMRIDLFFKTVCGKFALSCGMTKRAVKAHSAGDITLYICSVEDILLFKSMTEREGDLEDCVRIVYEHMVDWDVVLSEAQQQSKAGHDVWITWITTRLEDLEDRNIKIPIMRKMRSLSDDYIEKWESELRLRNPERFRLRS